MLVIFPVPLQECDIYVMTHLIDSICRLDILPIIYNVILCIVPNSCWRVWHLD
jgi:hypothetical protein